MKVTCEYCGACVETEEVLTCPHCGASLAGPIVQAKQEAQQKEEKAQALEKERRDADYEDRLLEAFGAVAVAAATGGLGGGRKRSLFGRLLRRLIGGIHGGK